MKIRFWGVRGSIACPGPDTVVYGGNTSCIELRLGKKQRLVIIDAGSGIRPLGNALMENARDDKPILAEIFLTHTHWDHIMGFPFFSPIYSPTTTLTIYGPVTFEDEPLEDIVGGQLRYRYFPVMYNELSAKIQYRHLRENVLDIGDGIVVRTKFLNHTLQCLGYRFEWEGRSVCTAFDTEPFRNVLSENIDAMSVDPVLAESGEAAARAETEKMRRFYAGADVLIHDAQFTAAEYEAAKKGWGHTAMEHAIDAALEADVKQLILFHHDPSRTDTALGAIEAACRERLPSGSRLTVAFAREGMEICL